MSIIKSNMTATPPAAAGGGGASLSSIGEMNCLRFDGESYLSRAASDIANNSPNSPWTFSVWLKRSDLADNGVFSAYSRHNGHWQPDVYAFRAAHNFTAWLHDNGSGYKWNHISTELFRDTNAWYHMVFQHNNGDGTHRVYVNGTAIIDTNSNHSYASINSSVEHLIGAHRANPGSYYNKFKGYMADIHYIDGDLVSPEAFAEQISGTWVPKEYKPADYSAYGANGFHLDFSHRGRTIIHQNSIEQGDSNHSLVFDPIPSQLGTKAICFRGPSDHALTVTPWLHLSGDLTLEAWVNKNSDDGSVNDNRCLFSLNNTEFYYRPASNGYHYWNNSTGHTSLFPSAQSGAGWEHVAYVRESGVWRVYLNGVQGTATHTDNASYSNNFFTIGGYNSTGTGDSFHGAMNHIRLSNVARYTSANIANYQTATSNFTTDSDTLLLITANENEGSGVTTFVDQSDSADVRIGYDSSGNNNHWQAN